MKKIATVLMVALAMSISVFGAQNKNAKPPAKPSNAAAKAPAKPKAAPAPVDDASVAAAVKAKLAKTPSLKTANLDASSKDGVVTLTGSVKTGGAKGVATNVAKSVKGVKKVDNQITVEAKAAPAKKAPAANKAPAAKSTKPKGNKNG